MKQNQTDGTLSIAIRKWLFTLPAAKLRSVSKDCWPRCISESPSWSRLGAGYLFSTGMAINWRQRPILTRCQMTSKPGRAVFVYEKHQLLLSDFI